MKSCYGKCARCVWRYNGGCSEWRGKMGNAEIANAVAGARNPLGSRFGDGATW